MKQRKTSWISGTTITTNVKGPYRGAAKKQRCYRYEQRPFGVENGPACGPHRQRRELYRRWLKAQQMTQTV